MDKCFLSEMLKVLFLGFKNNPGQLVSIFNTSNILAAFDYNLESTRIIQESHSMTLLLGGNHPIATSFEERTINQQVYPADINKYTQYFNALPITNSLSHPEIMLFIFKKMRCRLKHTNGFWKPLTFISFDYLEPKSNTIHKYGFITNGKKVSQSSNEETRSLINTGPGNKLIRPMGSKILNVTKREKEVLHLIGKGYIAKEIACDLHISTTTVISHRKNLINKFEVKNTAELIKQASKLMII